MNDADVPTIQVHALPYHRTDELKSDPWYAVVVAIGWTAITLTVIHVGTILTVLVFGFTSGSFASIAGGRYRILMVVKIAFYGVLMIGGWRCVRLRPSAWRLTTFALGMLVAFKTLMTVVGFLTTFAVTSSMGSPQAMLMACQSIFATAAELVPLVLLFWLLNRPSVREMLDRITPSRP